MESDEECYNDKYNADDDADDNEEYEEEFPIPVEPVDNEDKESTEESEDEIKPEAKSDSKNKELESQDNEYEKIEYGDDPESSENNEKSASDDGDGEDIFISEDNEEDEEEEEADNQEENEEEKDESNGKEREGSPDDQEDDFSLEDLPTEDEEYREGSDIEYHPENIYQLNKLDAEIRKDELEAANEIPEESAKPAKEKKYRRLHKDPDDTSATEYETITDDSEQDGGNTNEIKEIEVAPEREKVATPVDPFPWIEYSKETKTIEEMDDDFLEKFFEKWKSSLSSSSDECEDNTDSFDLPKFKIPPVKLSMVRIQNTENTITEPIKQKTKPIKKERNEIENHKFAQPKKVKKENFHFRKPSLQSFEIDLNVFNHFKYPSYNCRKLSRDNKSEGPNKDRKHRKKIIKRFKKRRHRNEIYKRLHKNSVNNSHLEDGSPDEDIPSYKVKKKYMKSRENIINSLIDIVLESTFKIIDEIELVKMKNESELVSSSILFQLFNDVIDDIEKRRRDDAINYSINVLLDKWEEHVYERKRASIEDQIDKGAEKIVVTTIDNVLDEDVYSTLLVREVIAESLDKLGMKRTQIHKDLRIFFKGYNFNRYVFNTPDSVPRVKQYRQIKTLNEMLETRKDPVVKSENFERLNSRKRSRKNKNIKRNNKIEIQGNEKESLGKESALTGPIEKAASNENRVETELASENNGDNFDCESPCFIIGGNNMLSTQDNLDTDSSMSRSTPAHRLNAEEAFETFERMRRRSTVVSTWANDVKSALEVLREENSKKMKKSKLVLGDEYLYSASASSECESEDMSKPKVSHFANIPQLKEEVEKAFREDNESDDAERKENMPGIPQNVTSSETQPVQSHFLEASAFEKSINDDEVLKSIPELDRDQYLSDWLQNGVDVKVFRKQLPSPPTSANTRKVKRYHLKRPKSACTEISNPEVKPIDKSMYGAFIDGRLNSALSNHRPGTASTVYSNSESIYSVYNNTKSDSDLESTDSTSLPQRYKKYEYRFDRNVEKKTPHNSDKEGCTYYLRYKNRPKSRKKYKTKIDEQIPNTIKEEISDIIDKYSRIKLDDLPLNGDGDKNETTLIRFERNNSFENNNEEMISPPQTPWQLSENRPLTPDSQDTSEELKELKNKYWEPYMKERKKCKRSNDPRKWKSYLKEKKQIESDASAETGVNDVKLNLEDDHTLQKGNKHHGVDSEALSNPDGPLFQKVKMIKIKEEGKGHIKKRNSLPSIDHSRNYNVLRDTKSNEGSPLPMRYKSPKNKKPNLPSKKTNMKKHTELPPLIKHGKISTAPIPPRKKTVKEYNTRKDKLKPLKSTGRYPDPSLSSVQPKLTPTILAGLRHTDHMIAQSVNGTKH